MIPGCSLAELLDVGHVVVNTLKAVEGKENVVKYSASAILLPWQCRIYSSLTTRTTFLVINRLLFGLM